MEQDLAERFAATSLPNISTGQVQKILQQYLRWISVCPVCKDTGWITLRRNYNLTMLDSHGVEKEMHFKEGDTAPCPHCGGFKEGDQPRGDPDFVAWHCWVDNNEEACRTLRVQGNDADRSKHGRCGFQILLPLPPPEGAVR